MIPEWSQGVLEVLVNLVSEVVIKEHGKFTVVLFMGKVTLSSLLEEIVVRFWWGLWASLC